MLAVLIFVILWMCRDNSMENRKAMEEQGNSTTGECA